MSSTPPDSAYWMHRALLRAHDALHRSDPNPRVGCVLVRDDVVIGEGATQAPGGPHAEVEALRDARERGHDPRGATAYVTLEPCSHFGRTPPCVDALIAAGIGRVVAALEDPNPLVAGRGFTRFRDAGIAVETGVAGDAARELNIGFVSRMTRGRPWVRMKVAASLDGQSALANGRSQWITGEAARRDGHAWRARASALLTGIGTVRLDDPRLDVRDIDTPRQPWRVLVDSRFEVPLDARIVRHVREGRRLVVVGAIDDAARRVALEAAGCETWLVPNRAGKVDLAALVARLGTHEVNELHVEAGGQLNGSLLRAGLVDELLVYLAPCLLGPGMPMVALPPLDALDGRLALTYHDVARIGDDLRIRARVGSSRRPADAGASDIGPTGPEQPAPRSPTSRQNMFTGIVAAVGRITRVAPESSDPRAGVRVTIDAGPLPLDGVSLGDSIAIAGACMTVVALDGPVLEFDVSRESLDRTVGLDCTGPVNLEKALRFGDRLDGHLVSGHIDGTGVVQRFEPIGESWTLIVRAPLTLARFIALKGSVAVNGVSLTINTVDDHEKGCDFSINLIPHTVAVTTLKHLAAGDRVNLEIDTIARYVERMLGASREQPAPHDARATSAG